MKKLISALSSLCLATTSLLGAFPALPAPVAVKANAAGKVVYDLVPHGKTFTAASGTGNNKYQATAGENLTIDWIIKDDPGTAGIQVYLDFKEVEVVKATVGDAYDLTPEFNDSDANKGGQIVYAWAKSALQDCDTDEAICSFNVKVPSTDGTYTVGLDTKEKNKVVPVNENDPYTIEFHGLDIVVGDPSSNKTTEKPAPQPGSNSVIYNIVPSKGTYTDAQSSGKAYNEYTAQPGETLTVDWKIKNDPGTAGIQMYLNFKDVELVKGTVGDAYDVTPEFNTTDANKGGQVVYAWAKNEVQDCDTDEAIASFQIKVPSADGTYYIDLDTKEVNKVVPKDETKPYDIAFYGLKITVGEPGKTTEKQPPVPGENSVIYNIVPSKGSYTDAQSSGKAYNEYTAQPGETLTVDWKVTKDPGTAGIQMYLNFKDVELVKGTVGDAYDLTPEFNTSDANKGGQVVYAWAKDSVQDCDTDEAIASFQIKVPSADGTYYIDLDTKEINKVVPKDETKPYDIAFYGLKITVGEPGKTTEKQPPVPGENSVIYNIVPSKGTYTDAQSSGKAYNEYTAQPGETLTVDWKVTKDPGTAGIQMYLNFKDVELVKGTVGDAYDLTPEFNTSDANKGGQVVYAWAKDSVQDVDKDEAIASFQIKVPEADGTYYIDLDTKEVNKVVPKDETKPYDICFYGLKITVGEPGKTTEKQPPVPTENSVIYNIVPSKGTYTDAQSNNKAYNEYTAQPGETLTVDWKVAKDPGTAGMQIYLNFKDVEVLKTTVGDAYDLTPEFNASDANKGGQVVYAWAKDTVQDVDKDEAIASFQIKVPEADGTYYIDLDTKEVNKVVPKDETKPYDICFYGLKITVGEPGKTTEKQPPVPTENSVIYNVVPQTGKYTDAQSNNKAYNEYTAQPGETLTVDWKVTKDPGTAGIQMYLNFKDVEVVKATVGDAYDLTPEFNASDANKGGQVVYAWAKDAVQDVDMDEAIASFQIKVPEAQGTYYIDLDTKEVNKVVPKDETKPYDICFYGLKIVVEGDRPYVEPTADSVVYNLIPEGKTYTKAQEAKIPNNVVEVAAGEELTVNWMATNDQGAAGIQMYFDFSQVEYVKGTVGDAYDLTPEFNDKTVAKDGVVVYAWAKKAVQEIDESEALATFKVKAPSEEGSYIIDLVRSENNKVVPVDESKPTKFVFYGLEIKVVPDVTTTSTQPTTTSTTSTSDTVPTTTVTTTTTVTPAGKSNWVIGEKTVAGGVPVKVPVTVSNDEGTAGFVVKFAYDEKLQFVNIDWADGYTGEATINDDKQVVVWASDKGSNENADGIVMYLNFIAPADKGEYPVKFASIEVTNTEGKPIEAITTDGKVIVDPQIPSGGKSNWTIGEVTTPGNTEVKVPVTVTGDEGTAGFVVKYNYNEKLTFKKIEWANGYSGEATLNDDKQVAVWASETGSNENADGVVMYLVFDAPAEAGTYPVKFASLDVCNTEGAALTVTKKDGAVIVDPTIIPAGKSNWLIGTETVRPGASVAVPVKVTGDEGTAGFVVQFKHDEALKFNGFTWADGYTGEATLNGDKLTVVWANERGADEKADGVVLYLNFTAPEAKGEYPVEFQLLEVVNTDGQPLTVEKTNGAVIVDPEVTTTTSVTTPTTTTTPLVIPEGSVGWIIGRKEVTLGVDELTVKVPVTVKGDTGTAGFVVEFDYDPQLTFVDFEWTKGYTGEAVLNKDKGIIVWASDDGGDLIAPDDLTVVNLIFTVPEKVGEYPVKFTNLEVVDTNGNPLKTVKQNGAVVVKAPDETTTDTSETTIDTSTTITTVSTSETEPSKTSTTDISTVSSVSTTDTDTSKTSTTDISTVSSVSTTDTDTDTSKTSTTDISTVSSVSTTDTDTSKTSTTDISTVSSVSTTDTDTSKTSTTDISTVSSVSSVSTTDTDTSKTSTTDISTVSSVSTVSTTDTDLSNTSTTDISTVSSVSTVSTIDTVPTTSVSVTAPIPHPGHVVYKIDDVKANSGEIAKVPVYVWYDDGTAGLKMRFAVPEGFVIEGVVIGDAYTNNGEFIWNGDPTKYALEWDAANGEAQKAEPGSTLITLLVRVPKDAEGLYPVKFVEGSVDVSDGNAKILEHQEIDGSIDVTRVITPVEPGNAIYKIGSATGEPGSKVQVPLTVWYDDGTTDFEIQIDTDLPIDGLDFNPAYTENGKFEWDPETKTLKWTRNDDSDFAPKPGDEIAKINGTVSADAKPGTDIPVRANGTAKDKDGNPINLVIKEGNVHVADIVVTTTVTTVSGTDITTVSTVSSVSTTDTDTSNTSTTDISDVSTVSSVSTTDTDTSNTSTTDISTVSTVSSVSTTNTDPSNTSTTDISTVSTVSTVSTTDTDTSKTSTSVSTTDTTKPFTGPTTISTVDTQTTTSVSTTDTTKPFTGPTTISTTETQPTTVSTTDTKPFTGPTTISTTETLPTTVSTTDTKPFTGPTTISTTETLPTTVSTTDTKPFTGPTTISTTDTLPTTVSTTDTQPTTISTTDTQPTTISTTDTQPTTISTTDTQPTTISTTDTQPTTISTTDTQPTTISTTDTQPTTISTTGTEPNLVTGTTTTPETGKRVVTAVKYDIKPVEEKLNFWSHDTRNIADSRNLKEMSASLTLYKYYVNDDNQFVNAKGDVLTDGQGQPFVYVEGQDITVPEMFAFDVKTKDIAAQIAPAEELSTPAKIWESERKAQYGDAYVAWDQDVEQASLQDYDTEHANKYSVKLYFDPTKVDDPDFQIGTAPIEVGELKVYIGVKGDFNLNNKVDLRDVHGALKYYTWQSVSHLEPEELVGVLSSDPELDGEDGLIFYLINVVYRDGKTADSPVSATQKINLLDQRALLKYYTYRYVSKLEPDEYSWEEIVGYDNLDSFYGDSYD